MTAPLQRRKRDKGVHILEVGAGTGSFTKAIIHCMQVEDTLTLYEINPEFSDYLDKNILSQAPAELSIQLKNENILTVQDHLENHYDFIISGLPFTNFSPCDVETCLTLYMNILKPGGILTFLEYLHVRDAKLKLSLKSEERQRAQQIDDLIKEFQHRFNGTQSDVFRNIPPSRVFKLIR
jgi:phospholipid N-methyltransferase